MSAQPWANSAEFRVRQQRVLDTVKDHPKGVRAVDVAEKTELALDDVKSILSGCWRANQIRLERRDDGVVYMPRGGASCRAR